jgi:hypothetical protein
MAWLSANAMQEGNRKESWLLFRQAYRYGTPSVLDVILFAGIWLFPPKMRAKMVLLFLGKRPVSPGLPSERA